MIPEKLRKIKLSDFDFALNEEAIAQNPLAERDTSKLLEYKDGKIIHSQFKNLPQLLPVNSRLILNNAKVIPARLKFYKTSGAKIEVFLLEPRSPFTQFELAFNVKGNCVWQCMIGNLKRWKEDEILSKNLKNGSIELELTAQLISRENQLVKLSWKDYIPFSEILDLAGKTPLPPYIKRQAELKDAESYQTVFAKEQGAVAAPTAGLHFSEKVFQDLRSKEIETTQLTLFVGAGTFAPVIVENMIDHDMHEEMISVSAESIQQLLTKNIRIAVGTTSLRTLESLYWIGVKIHNGEQDPLKIEKLYPYTIKHPTLTWIESLQCVKEYMSTQSLDRLLAKTAILIMEGYEFKSVNALITNFHFPNTTLIMLIAAFVGEDWKKIYKEALDNNYRFLSYGDSSLLWRKNEENF